MLKTRIITAFIGFIIAVCAITIGGLTFNLCCALLALLGWREFAIMTKRGRVSTYPLWGAVLTILIMVCVSFGWYASAFMVLIGGVLWIYVTYIFAKKLSLPKLAMSLFGILYVVGGFTCLLMLRNNGIYQYFKMPFTTPHPGELMIWLLLFCTWASDSAAYFTGRKWGKTKIVPTISPNKSLEGFIGGFFGCLIVGFVYAYIFGLPLQVGLIVGVITGIFAPLGDLFESKIKRVCQVKDSGTLLPGHGGVLDRFDSLLFAAPVVFIYLLYL